MCKLNYHGSRVVNYHSVCNKKTFIDLLRTIKYFCANILSADSSDHRQR